MRTGTLLLGTIGAVAVVAATLQAAVGVDPVFSNPTMITNSYHPFVPGRVKHFEVQQGHTDGEVFDSYLPDLREFQWNGTSVMCRTLEERELEDDELVEISHNYFAQADDGTVYYFGEVVDIYENGAVVDHGGSWLVGGPTLPSDPAVTADAPDPAVFMPADPQLGDVYKPEDLYPLVDESDLIVKTGQNVSTPADHFTDCIQVLESTQLSDETETKWYAPGIGVIKAKEKGEVLILDEIMDP